MVDTMISRQISNDRNSADGNKRQFRMIHDLKNIRNLAGVFIGFAPYCMAYFKGTEWNLYKKVDDLF